MTTLIQMIPAEHVLASTVKKCGVAEAKINSLNDIVQVVSVMSEQSDKILNMSDKIIAKFNEFYAAHTASNTPAAVAPSVDDMYSSDGTAIQKNTFNKQIQALTRAAAMAPQESALKPVLETITGESKMLHDLLIGFEDHEELGDLCQHYEYLTDVPVSTVTSDVLKDWAKYVGKQRNESAKVYVPALQKIWTMIKAIQSVNDLNLIDYIANYAGMPHDGESYERKHKLSEGDIIDYRNTQIGNKDNAMDVIDKLIATVNDIDRVDVNRLITECADSLMKVSIEVNCLPKQKQSKKFTEKVQAIAKQENADICEKRMPKSEVPVSPVELIAECNAVRNKRQALIDELCETPHGEIVIPQADYDRMHDELMEVYLNRKERVLAMITSCDMDDMKSWPELDNLDTDQVREGWDKWLAEMDRISGTGFQYRNIEDYLNRMNIKITPDQYVSEIPKSMIAAKTLQAAAVARATAYEQSCFDTVVDSLKYVKAKLETV